MLRFFAPYKKFFLFLLVLSAIIIYLIYQALVPKRVLPILVNHLGDTITQEKFENKVYVADFFFTTCQTICPKMTQNMNVLQQKLKDQNVMLLSHTVMPEIDSVAQLKKYADKKGVDSKKWDLVTGSKKELYDLARKSYLVAKAKPYSKYDLIHTENFVLVDQKKRIRGYYDGTDMEAIEQLLLDIKLLLKN